MPNSKSVEKRHRQSLKRRARNRFVKGNVRGSVKAFNVALEQGNIDSAKEAFRAMVKDIDSAVSKGVVPKNTAARKKSRLAKKLNAFSAS